jgi:excinuclease ABC subunit C
MKDAAGTVIYVGKAVNLRNRVRSYFHSSRDHSPKVARLVEKIADLDYVVTDSELEALILECNLIKEHRPRYNVRLRDDKSYPFIRVTLGETYPRIFVTRKVVRDGSRYFGPFADVNAVHDTLRLLKKVFPIRQCSRRIDSDVRSRPCLNFHIKRCLGPCSGGVDPACYRELIDEVLLFLEGRQWDLVRSLRRRMEAAADALDFEQAAVLRDQVQALERVIEKQKIVSDNRGDQDVVAIARDERGACVQVLLVRDGKLVGGDHFIPAGMEEADDSEALSAFVTQYYSDTTLVPPEILLSTEIEGVRTLERWLSSRSGSRVSIRVPKRGEKRKLVELAATNAAAALVRARARSDSEEQVCAEALVELSRAVGLAAPPKRIECYDISNLQGTEAVGSMVVFEDGRPAKSEYRRFRIRGAEGQNDFAAMAEIIGRRIRRGTGDCADPKFARLPDLIVVDGGRGQLNAAVDSLRASGAHHIPAVSLAKKEEEILTPHSPDPIVLPRESLGLRLIQHLRDEAHRFAVSYHRTVRGKRSITSELTGLPGIGRKRLIALMRKFRSLDALAEASMDDIASTPGMTRPSASVVYGHLHPEAGGSQENQTGGTPV